MEDQDIVSRLNAALEGRYRIERQLGEGGMASVYLADDLRHERKVALKVLKPELAAVVGAERFLAEIKTTANLQHPHILPLFDSGEADSFLFYVMPYVEGESLRERLDREHQLPVEEAVRIATNVAEALEYAHSHGVIHRDIKPANILLQAGKPVVSDFGIALAVGVAGGGRLTETGLSLGTPHYMSPEQATGDQSVGVATDIYALGAVLYEMLVGDPPYVGSTAQAILGKIIAGELASAAKQRSSVPAHVDAAIRKALEKLPADRFGDAGAFSRALADTRFRHGVVAEPPTTRQRLAWQGAAVLMVGAAIGGAVVAAAMDDGEKPAPGIVQFTITPPEEAGIAVAGNTPDLAISRDGGLIAYQSRSGSGPSGLRLDLRPFDQLESAPLRGSETGEAPFFSPDGEWVGFVDASDGPRIMKVSVLGGRPVVLTETPAAPYGLSWGADDRIVFGTTQGLFSVAGGGGEPEALTAVDSERGERAHLWPHVIDGEELVLFEILSDGPELAILDLASGEVTRLGVAGVGPRYTSTGHIVYAAGDGSLRAVPFDLRTRETTGSPVPLVEGVQVKGAGAANFDLSDDGRLVYVLGPAVGEALVWEFVWVDREGNEEPLPTPAAAYLFPRLSPDGRQIAVSIEREEGIDLWVYDARAGASLRLTRDDERNWVPIWTPDGHILFSSTLAQRPSGFQGAWWGNVYSVAADGSGMPVRVSETDENQGLTGLSPDGRTMVYSRVTQNQWEIIGRPLDGDAEPRVLVSGPFRQGTGSISPDGRWLAYRSDESGQFEVYVQPYPRPGAKVPVSIGGGTQPVWSSDSREIFYRTLGDDVMMSATISGEGTPRVTARTALFSAARYRNGGADFRQYHVAPDGRFLMMRRAGLDEGDGATPGRINVILNWFEELRERVPN